MMPKDRGPIRCGVCGESGHDRRLHDRLKCTCPYCGAEEMLPRAHSEVFKSCRSTACQRAHVEARGMTPKMRAALDRLHQGMRDGTVRSGAKTTCLTLRAEMAVMAARIAELEAELEMMRRREHGHQD